MTFYDEHVIMVQMPQKIALKVMEAPSGIKGNTATSATKEVVLETGVKAFVPMFIKEGDIVVINTETKAYDSKQQN